MMNRVIFISHREGEKMSLLDPFRHHLTKKAVMAMPKVRKGNSLTWGGWIHAFIVWERPNIVTGSFVGNLNRFDAVND